MKINKYIKKTIPIEAFIWKGYNEEDWQQVKDFLHITSDIRVSVNSSDVLKIHTLSERACDERDYSSHAKIGDYIIKDTYGDITSCTAEVFQETYETVEDEL